MPIKNAICFWHREAEGRGDLFEIASPPAGGAYWRGHLLHQLAEPSRWFS